MKVTTSTAAWPLFAATKRGINQRHENPGTSEAAPVRFQGNASRHSLFHLPALALGLMLSSFAGVASAADDGQSVTSNPFLLSQTERNALACEDDGAPEPNVSAGDFSELAAYMLERNLMITINPANDLDWKNVPEYNPTSPDPRYSQKRTGNGLGTGWMCESDGKFVTNHHVVESAITNNQPITVYRFVRQADGSLEEQEFVGEILSHDQQRDLAYLQLKTKDGEALPKGTFPTYQLVEDSDLIAQGMEAYSLGNPRGLPGTFTNGLVSSPEEWYTGQMTDDKTIPLSVPSRQVSVPITSGNSGGAIALKDGRMALVSDAILQGNGDIGFAIPANEVANFIAAQKTGLSLQPMLLGMKFNSAFSYENLPTKIREAGSRLAMMKYELNRFNYLIDTKLPTMRTSMDAGELSLGAALEEIQPEPPEAQQMADALGRMFGVPADALKQPEVEVKDGMTAYEDLLERVTKPRDQLVEAIAKQRENVERLEATLAAAKVSVGDAEIEGGVMVDTVFPDTLAAQAGIQANDVVTHLDGEEVSHHNFPFVVKAHYVWQPITITFMRNGETHVVTVNQDGFQKALAAKADNAP